MPLEGKSAEEIAALAELAEQLANNPKTRKGFLHLSKASRASRSVMSPWITTASLGTTV